MTADAPVYNAGAAGVTAGATNGSCTWHFWFTQLGQTAADWW